MNRRDFLGGAGLAPLSLFMPANFARAQNTILSAEMLALAAATLALICTTLADICAKAVVDIDAAVLAILLLRLAEMLAYTEAEMLA